MNIALLIPTPDTNRGTIAGTKNDPRAASTAGGLATTYGRGSDMDEHTSPEVHGKAIEDRLAAIASLARYAAAGKLDPTTASDGITRHVGAIHGLLDAA